MGKRNQSKEGGTSFAMDRLEFKNPLFARNNGEGGGGGGGGGMASPSPPSSPMATREAAPSTEAVPPQSPVVNREDEAADYPETPQQPASHKGGYSRISLQSPAQQGKMTKTESKDVTMPLELITRCPDNGSANVDRTRFAAAASGILHFRIEDEKISEITRTVNSGAGEVAVKEKFRYLYPDEEVEGTVYMQVTSETQIGGISIILKAEENISSFAKEERGVNLKDCTTITLWKVETDLDINDEVDRKGDNAVIEYTEDEVSDGVGEGVKGYVLKPGVHRWRFSIHSPPGHYAPAFTSSVLPFTSSQLFGTASVRYSLLAVINRIDKEKDNPLVSSGTPRGKQTFFRTMQKESESMPVTGKSMVDLRRYIQKNPAQMKMVKMNSVKMMRSTGRGAEVGGEESGGGDRPTSAFAAISGAIKGTPSPSSPSSRPRPASDRVSREDIPTRHRREETLEDDYDIIAKGSGIKVFRKRVDLFPRAEVHLSPYPGNVPSTSAHDTPVLVRRNMSQDMGGMRGMETWRLRETIVAIDKAVAKGEGEGGPDAPAGGGGPASASAGKGPAIDGGSSAYAKGVGEVKGEGGDEDEAETAGMGGLAESEHSPLNYAIARLKVKTKRGIFKRKLKTYAFIKVYSDRFYLVQDEEFFLNVAVNNDTAVEETAVTIDMIQYLRVSPFGFKHNAFTRVALVEEEKSFTLVDAAPFKIGAKDNSFRAEIGIPIPTAGRDNPCSLSYMGKYCQVSHALRVHFHQMEQTLEIPFVWASRPPFSPREEAEWRGEEAE
mmetsp:Transcript_20391/g.52228  ORF Transcript_20391/g.52228 Transcript_20391/m.52228 type:complete len:779 (-) Transcript_20391:71-2407(-)